MDRKQRAKEKSKTYRERNPEKYKEYHKEYCKRMSEHRKNYNLMFRFGITRDDYDHMLKTQNESCAICKSHKSSFSKSLSVDHNHNTGYVRGLLCSDCNRGIGLLKDNPDILQEALHYLKKEFDDPIQRF